MARPQSDHLTAKGTRCSSGCRIQGAKLVAGRERIHRWWRPADGADTTTRAGSIQAGKPNVSFRKIINTTLPDGETIGVNAQCYTVLVMDVPDLRRERKRWGLRPSL